MRHHPILLIVVLGSIVCFGRSYGQVNSPAFDPNCYFPRIGVPGEIDTIVGPPLGEYLGQDIQNIGPFFNENYGRVICHFDVNDTYDSVFSTGPKFNLHKLNIVGKFQWPKDYHFVRFGHFHSLKYSDMLTIYDDETKPARIYWQNDQGNYDTSLYTVLNSSLQGKIYTDYARMPIPYTSKISSDTVEDIIHLAFIANTNTSKDSLFFLYFQGGQTLYDKGKYAYSDSIIFYDTLDPSLISAGCSQGDFRGVKRNDLIFSNHKNNFYFKNDPPFTMRSLAYSLLFDTLFAQWQNPKSQNSGEGLAMQALPKSSTDSSDDFLVLFESQYPSRPAQSVLEFRIFRGGKDFGSQRWTADSAAFIIHEPYYYDLNYHDMSFGATGGIRNCGHMTGTQNNVLYIEGTLDGGYYAYEYFYVLGDAIDDKVDMFIGPLDNHNASGSLIDTLVADNDNFQDIIMGHPNGGFNNAGSVFVVHGSDNIPEKTRSVHIIKDENIKIMMFPNPANGGKLNLDLSEINQQDLKISIWDLLGRNLYSEHIYAPFMGALHPILINSIPTGTYIIEITGKKFNQRIQLSVLK